MGQSLLRTLTCDVFGGVEREKVGVYLSSLVSVFSSQDAIQADLARKKDEEMRRLKQEKRKHLCTVLKAQIDDKTRVDPRPPSMV